MCNSILPHNAFSQFVCRDCGKNNAARFKIVRWLDTNEKHRKAMRNMNFDKYDKFWDEVPDKKTGKMLGQYNFKKVGEERAWFAVNENKIPELSPICDACTSSLLHANIRFIQCHYGIEIYKMQPRV